MTTSEIIRTITKEKGLKFTELAARMGKTKQYINTQLSRGDSFTVTTLKIYADALGVHPAELLGGQPPQSETIKEKKYICPNCGATMTLQKQ